MTRVCDASKGRFNADRGKVVPREQVVMIGLKVLSTKTDNEHMVRRFQFLLRLGTGYTASIDGSNVLFESDEVF